jgi:NTP pyrophosphatase (non-canonical NTP hydrolase)
MMTREQLVYLCIAEELGEVAKEFSKAIRFGLHDTAHEGRSNLARINEEWSQVNALLDILSSEYGVTLEVSEFEKEKKYARFEQYYAYSQGAGRVC